VVVVVIVYIDFFFFFFFFFRLLLLLLCNLDVVIYGVRAACDRGTGVVARSKSRSWDTSWSRARD
jgi:hypothetical protein